LLHPGPRVRMDTPGGERDDHRSDPALPGDAERGGAAGRGPQVSVLDDRLRYRFLAALVAPDARRSVAGGSQGWRPLMEAPERADRALRAAADDRPSLAAFDPP